MATIVVALAVAAMIGLGLWQLRRAEWKEALLAEMARAAAAPPLAIDDGALPADLAFRRARLRLVCPDQLYDARAGRDALGRSGWAWRAACLTGGGERVTVVLGWSADSRRGVRWTQPRRQLATGVLVPSDHTAIRAIFYLAVPPPTLAPAAPPTPADVPNNHRSYAVQWFSFAVIAAAIYALALRRRGA